VPFKWKKLRKESELKRIILRDTSSESGNHLLMFPAAFKVRCIVSDAGPYSIQWLRRILPNAGSQATSTELTGQCLL
jgi:hypothetical protein